ncbi:MAG: hypothetical protein ACJ782_22820, partial [Actinomycetota bacterium]
RPRGRGRGQGLRHLLPNTGPQLPGLPGHRRPLEPLPLALPAQRRRVPPPWGKAEQWLLSAQHTDEDVDRFLANFAAFADAVSR